MPSSSSSAAVDGNLASACDVCSDATGSLLCCSGCGVKVHPLCYGIKSRKPSKREVWMCKACESDDADALMCIFCPSSTRGGALKPCQTKKNERSRRRERSFFLVWHGLSAPPRVLLGQNMHISASASSDSHALHIHTSLFDGFRDLMP